MNRDKSIFLALALLAPAAAHAYVDPGFGALVWQAAFAAIVGAIFFLRNTIGASFRWMRKKMGGGDAGTPPKDAEPSERPTEPG